MGESAGRNIWEVLGSSAGTARSDSPTPAPARTAVDSDALTVSL